MQLSEKIQQIMKILKKNFLKVFLIFFFMGYMIFLTSYEWYPTKADLVQPTALLKETSWNNRKVTILSWDYSESQKMMEIKLDISSSALDDISTYNFKVMERNDGYQKVEKVVEQDDYVVLRITDLKKNWSEISLKMSLPDGVDLQERKLSDTELKMYTNSQDVNKVNFITDKSDQEYIIERLNDRIQEYATQIDNLQQEIESYNQTIQGIENNISGMQEKEKYQTDEQIKDTEKIIASAKSDINSLQSEITSDNNKIIEYNKRITKAQEEMSSY